MKKFFLSADPGAMFGLVALVLWLGQTEERTAKRRAAVLLALTNWVKPTKKLHPIVFIALSAVVGVVFQFGRF